MPNSIPTCELNMRCAGVKRLLKEACELRVPNELFIAKPMEDNLFEWHFTIRGPPDSVYHNGIYHGRIILPVEYPMKPPSLILLTPNGRFETNKKICLSISGYHPETWLPSWSIRTALLALIGFMPTHSKGALGGLECSETERRRLATKSLDWRCEACECTMRDILPLMQEAASASSNSALLDELKTASTGSPATKTSMDNTAATSNASSSPTPNAKTPILTSSVTEASSGSGVAREARIIASVVSVPARLFASALALISTGRNSSTTTGGEANAGEGGTASSAASGVGTENTGANAAAGNANASIATTTPNRANRRSWAILVWIFIFSAVFFALLLRRILNA